MSIETKPRSGIESIKVSDGWNEFTVRIDFEGELEFEHDSGSLYVSRGDIEEFVKALQQLTA